MCKYIYHWSIKDVTISLFSQKLSHINYMEQFAKYTYYSGQMYPHKDFVICSAMLVGDKGKYSLTIIHTTPVFILRSPE